MATSATEKIKLFDSLTSADHWREVQLLGAVCAVYMGHLVNDQKDKSFQGASAGADAWTIHEVLVNKLYTETMTAWSKLTEQPAHTFAWTPDRVAALYEFLRKSAKKVENLVDESARMHELVKNFVGSKANLMAVLLLCVLRVFMENVTNDGNGDTLRESRKARSDSWARNSILREEIVFRVTSHWSDLTGKAAYEFPWNATIVARTYLIVRKEKDDIKIDNRRKQLEMILGKEKEFKSARATLAKKADKQQDQ